MAVVAFNVTVTNVTFSHGSGYVDVSVPMAAGIYNQQRMVVGEGQSTVGPFYGLEGAFVEATLTRANANGQMCDCAAMVMGSLGDIAGDDPGIGIALVV